MALVPGEGMPTFQTSHRAQRGCLAAADRSGDIQTTLSAMFILGAAQEEATLQVVYSPHHSLIKLSFQGCPSPHVHTSVFKLWLGDQMVTYWWLLQLPHVHLTSGHSLGGFLAVLPFSLAILTSGWTEEASQVLCKTRKMEKKPTCQHQTTQRAALHLSHTGLGGSL